MGRKGKVGKESKGKVGKERLIFLLKILLLSIDFRLVYWTIWIVTWQFVPVFVVVGHIKNL